MAESLNRMADGGKILEKVESEYSAAEIRDRHERVRAGKSLARTSGKGGQSGYMLLILMLAVAMITVTLLTVAPNYRRSIQREREIEMIHRGTQYARAVRLYYKKFGHYPTSIDDLENTNKIRFLRKRYKDPMSPDGQWQIAHLSDLPRAVAVTLAGSLPGGGGAGAAGSIATTQLAQTNSNLSGGDLAQNGASRGTDAGSSAAANSSSNDSGGFGGDSPSGPADTGLAGTSNVIGGPMLGVVSKSKAEGIHSFNDKSHYNEWLFIYDPNQDRGQLWKGPYNPKLMLSTNTSGQPTSQPGSASPQNPSTPAAAPTADQPGSIPAPTANTIQ